MAVDQTGINAELHRTGNFVAEYDTRALRPVEVVLLARYSQTLSGRVLEVGCGGGRILGYLAALGGEVHGIDVSPPMIEHCRKRYPAAIARIADVRDLTPEADGRFDAILAGFNVIDVFDHTTRLAVLDNIRQLLKPEGLFIFSTHNLADVERSSQPAGSAIGRAQRLLSSVNQPPSFFVKAPGRLRERVRNQRRLRPLERREREYAIVNDVAYNYGALHYYIRRSVQTRQLEEHGFELLECLDLEGLPVGADEDGEGPELHYVARPKADV